MTSVGAATGPQALFRAQPLASRAGATNAAQRPEMSIKAARKRIDEMGTQQAQRSLRESAHMAARAALKSRARMRAQHNPEPPQTLQPTQATPKLLGDVNADGRLDRQDAVALLDYLFQGGARPEGLANADTNGDGRIDVGDVVKLTTLLRAQDEE